MWLQTLWNPISVSLALEAIFDWTVRATTKCPRVLFRRFRLLASWINQRSDAAAGSPRCTACVCVCVCNSSHRSIAYRCSLVSFIAYRDIVLSRQLLKPASESIQRRDTYSDWMTPDISYRRYGSIFSYGACEVISAWRRGDSSWIISPLVHRDYDCFRRPANRTTHRGYGGCLSRPLAANTLPMSYLQTLTTINASLVSNDVQSITALSV